MAQHTPGPWLIDDTLTGGAIVNADRRQVATANMDAPARGPGDEHEMVATRDANARLIAAAPELLAACIEAEKNYAPHDGPLLRQLRAAIERATKGEPR